MGSLHCPLTFHLFGTTYHTFLCLIRDILTLFVLLPPKCLVALNTKSYQRAAKPLLLVDQTNSIVTLSTFP
jgi:hypothetical protein